MPRLLAVLLLLAAAGCQGDALTPERAAALRAVSGGEQTALPGEVLSEPLRVRVEDASGAPVRGASVDWYVALGGGSVDAARSVTDEDGFATVRWTLGDVSGEQRVEARIAGAPAAVFGALATEVAEFRLSPRHARLGAPGEELVLRLLTRGAEGGDLASGVVTWQSSDAEVVTVFGGRIRAVGRGAATIIATGDGVADTMLVSVGIAANEPVAVTGQAQQRTSPSQVTLAGTAAGNGYEGTAWLDWGREADLSDAVQVGNVTLAATDTRGLAATVGGFALNDTLYFRAAAQTSQGLTRGSIARYVVAPPGPATGLAAQISPGSYVARLTWTPPARGVGYAVERREPGAAEWTSSPVYTSSTGGSWTEYPSLYETRTKEYRVRSCNAVGCATSGAVQLLVPRLEPAQNLAAAVTESQHVRLTWTDLSQETGWVVHRRVQGSAAPPVYLADVPRNAVTYTDSAIPLPGATYLYTVTAALSYGSRRSLPSAEAAATPGSGETYPPTATTGTGLQLVSPSSVTLRGSASGNNFAGQAWLEWSLDPQLAGATETVRDTLPATGTKSFSGAVTGLAPGTTVYFRAVAQNHYATVRGAIASYTVAPPAPPTGLQVDYGAPYFRVKLTWTPGERTASYTMERRSHADSAWRGAQVYSSNPGGNWLEYPDLSTTRTMEYRVRSCNAVGCVHSSSVSVLIERLEAPQGLTATVNAARDVVLSWTPGTMEQQYQVSRRTGSGTAVAIGTVARPATGFVDTTTVAGLTYHYTVRGIVSGGRSSPPSNEVSATPDPGATHPPSAFTGTAYQPIPEAGGGPTRATLRGSAQGNGFAGQAWFEWSTSPDLAGAAETARVTLAATGGKSLSAVVTGLGAGATIYFRAVAQNQYATVAGSISSYTLGPPGAPTGLQVQFGAPTYILKLLWTPGERTAGYAVQSRVQGEAAWNSTTMYTSSAGGSWTQYPSLASSRTMEYRVQSCNGAGCEYSGVVAQLIPRFDPPQGVTASVAGPGVVSLGWTDSGMETSYTIHRQVQGSSGFPAQVGTAPKDATSFTDSSATAGVTYVYTVRGVISYGSRSSAASNAATVTP